MHDSGVRECTGQMVYTINFTIQCDLLERELCIIKDASSIKFVCLISSSFCENSSLPNICYDSTIKLLNASTNITAASSTDLAYRKSGSFAQTN